MKGTNAMRTDCVCEKISDIFFKKEWKITGYHCDRDKAKLRYRKISFKVFMDNWNIIGLLDRMNESGYVVTAA